MKALFFDSSFSLILFVCISTLCTSFSPQSALMRGCVRNDGDAWIQNVAREGGHQVILKSKLPRFQALSNDEITSTADRIESLKVAVISAVGGSLAVLPASVVTGALSNFNAQWELSHDALVISLLLFGIVYRYSIRTDLNPQLKYGVIGAFAIVRALNMVVVPEICTAIPLNCGEPFFLFTPAMLGIGILNLIESLTSFGGAAYATEFCFTKGLLSKFLK